MQGGGTGPKKKIMKIIHIVSEQRVEIDRIDRLYEKKKKIPLKSPIVGLIITYHIIIVITNDNEAAGNNHRVSHRYHP